jgi:hypothetical protein
MRVPRMLLAPTMIALAAIGAAACSSSGGQAAGAATALPSVSPSTSPTPGRPAINGTAYFLAAATSPVQIMALRQGAVTVTATLPADASSCTHNSVRVSPDGQHLAWVAGGSSTDQGTFMLADIDGTHAVKLVDQVSCLGPTAIIWPGQGVVEAHTAKGGKWDFHVSNGQRVDGDPGDETDAVWSADGAAIAARDDSGSLYAATVGQLSGGNHHKVTYSPPADQAAHWDGFAPRSVSSDAAYLAVGWKGTDPSRQDGSFAIVDATTSQPVTLPESAIAHAEFLANGTTLIESGGSAPTLDILDAGWHVALSVPLPATVARLPLIRYVP